jgi:hypothetical protein
LTETPKVVGEAVLLDYPLRLWARQQEHIDGLIREFTLLLSGRETGQAGESAPERLIALAEMFNARFGPMLADITTAREEALRSGLDRMDSRVPLVDGTPELLGGVTDVLSDVDAYCARGALLTLARPPELVALSNWSISELIAQYRGAEPTPWPGPF